jgi:hypothetical protein
MKCAARVRRGWTSEVNLPSSIWWPDSEDEITSLPNPPRSNAYVWSDARQVAEVIFRRVLIARISDGFWSQPKNCLRLLHLRKTGTPAGCVSGIAASCQRAGTRGVCLLSTLLRVILLSPYLKSKARRRVERFFATWLGYPFVTPACYFPRGPVLISRRQAPIAVFFGRFSRSSLDRHQSRLDIDHRD